MALPITDIFVKTCLHDAEYHRYCMESIDKFCTGFRQTVVISGEHPRGYLDQQVRKLHADHLTDADFILFTDSDTLFTQSVTPESFMVDGKPIWLYTPWDDDLRAAVPWLPVMTQFAGKEPPAEFMRRQPFMVPSRVLPALREFCWRKHGRTMSEYIMDGTTFSEYNVLGHFCWDTYHELFHWINTKTDEMPPEYVKQFWSHDPIEKNLEEIQRILS